MNPIGIMQGRLSAPVGGRIQAFPVDTWRDELALALEAGLDCIEWVYEADTEPANPMRNESGIAEIRQLAQEAGVAVWSICADYYMSERLVSRDGVPESKNVDHLRRLLDRAALLGVKYVVLPFVDESALKSSRELEGLLTVLESTAPGTQIELHLETDLDAVSLTEFLKRVSHPLVRANYDIGNSASLGHHPGEELPLIGPWLGSVHVKDRILGGGTGPLGTGSADFPTCFRLISHAAFRGPYILQAARDDRLTEVELAEHNRDFVRAHLSGVPE